MPSCCRSKRLSSAGSVMGVTDRSLRSPCSGRSSRSFRGVRRRCCEERDAPTGPSLARRPGEGLGDREPLFGNVTLGNEARVSTMPSLRDDQTEVKSRARNSVGGGWLPPCPDRSVRGAQLYEHRGIGNFQVMEGKGESQRAGPKVGNVA